MKISLMILLTTMHVVCTYSQSLPLVMNSAGFNLQTSGSEFDISIGETVTMTFTGTKGHITQGYLQPDFQVANQVNYVLFPDLVKCYPNPFIHSVTLESNLEEFYTSVTDITGRIVLYKSIDRILDLSFLMSGIYHLTVTDKKNDLLFQAKICKSGN